MRKPRRKLSRLAGEKLAEKHGKFPADLKLIAEQEGIEIHTLPSKGSGVSGGISFTDPPLIFQSDSIRNQGFKRFTLAHELGHYFLGDHADIIMESGESHFSRAASGSRDPIEVEADQFAVGVLMPRVHSLKIFEKSEMGLAGVEALAIKANVSLIAAALRLVSLDPYPVGLCSSLDETVIFFALSESLKDLGCKHWPRNGDRLPTGTATSAFNLDKTKPSQLFSRSCITEWMDAPTMSIDEQIVSQRSFEGRTLTIITGKSLTSRLDDDFDADEALDASWLVQF